MAEKSVENLQSILVSDVKFTKRKNTDRPPKNCSPTSKTQIRIFIMLTLSPVNLALNLKFNI